MRAKRLALLSLCSVSLAATLTLFGAEDRSPGVGRRTAFVSEAPVFVGPAMSPKIDPLLARLVRDLDTRSPLVPSTSAELERTLVRTETLADGRLAAAVFVKTSNPAASRAEIEKAGGSVRVEAGDVLVCVVPVAALEGLAGARETISIEGSQYRRALLDVSRSATKADLVHSGSGLASPRTGAGVIVGVIDSGIDYTRADFKNADGTTRLRSIWDISGVASGGNARVCSSAEINSSACPERDLNGHGTHVAGIAAGAGRLQSGFVGMAPGADIIAAKATRSTTASGSFADDDVVAAASYIFQQAQAAGRPAVINMSIGGFGGPLDGTSAYEQALGNLTGAGRLIVVAAGNSGSATAAYGAEHLSYAVAGSNYAESFETPVSLASDGSTGIVLLWYNSGSINVGIAARTSSSVDTAVASPAAAPGQSISTTDLKDSADTVLAHYSIDASTTSYPGNGSHLVIVRIQQVASRYFSLYAYGSGTFDAWPINLTFGTRSDSYWKPGDARMTVGTPGTAMKVITVGAYTTKKQWTDVAGSPQTFTSWCDPAGNDVLGDIACFSSRGPTRDLRTKPEITAPGHRIASDLSVDAVPNQTTRNQAQGGKLLMESGTSQAAPHIAGIVALMLQGNPTLTHDAALQALQNTASQDSYTGAGINTTWGAGKVNALEAVKAVGGGSGPSVCTEDATTMCLVGGRYRIQSHWRNQYAGGATATLSKAKLTDVTGAFWIANASTYEYLIRFNTATNNGRIWIAIPTFTDVEFWIDVTDTHTGQSFQYHSAAGNRTLLYDPTTFVYP